MNTRKSCVFLARLWAWGLALALLLANAAQCGSVQFITSFPRAATGPAAGLTTDGSKLYGTAEGSAPFGSVFSTSLDGSNLQTVYGFSDLVPPNTIMPEAPVILDGSTLYGTTSRSSTGLGHIFAVDTDGSDFRALHAFGTNDGGVSTSLTLVGSTLYGTTDRGGGADVGTLFAVETNGANFRVLRHFSTFAGLGYNPRSPLLPVGSVLYGTTINGGLNDAGTLYSINPDGSGYRGIFGFPAGAGSGPVGKLNLVGTKLYGVSEAWGTGTGAVFSVNLDGSDFRVLHAFDGSDGYIGASGSVQTPGGLTVVGSKLYGTTAFGQQFNGGGVFSINLDGSDFEVVHAFQPSLREGFNPWGDLTLIGTTLYGTTIGGGQNGSGTIYAIVVPEPAGIVLAAVSLIGLLTWRLCRFGSSR